MNPLKSLSYNPLVIRSVRALHLRGISRKWYYRWARPEDGILRIQAAGIAAKFWVHTPEELRMLGKAQSRHWEHEVLEFLAHKLTDGGVVYDIGSNIGLYAVFLAKSIGEKGQVIAFEPESQAHERLRKNLQLNAIGNVRAFQVALGDYDREARLYFSDGDLLFANLMRPRHKKTSYEVVRVREGDRLRDAEGLPCPRVVKIDVEGFEYAVIKGLRRTLSDPNCKIVSCEVHPALLPVDVKEKQLPQLLQSLGFDRIDVHRWSGIEEYHILACKG